MTIKDVCGNVIKAGDVVVLLEVSQSLLADLPRCDQEIIKSKIGKFVCVEKIEVDDTIEVEFQTVEGDFHSRWVISEVLLKID